MGARVNYTPSQVFETFPLPSITSQLETLGEVLDNERREIMVRRGLGLTSLYNLMSDPDPYATDLDATRMRALHVRLDEAVMNAYGWSDIPLKHGVHLYREIVRWTVDPAIRIEILDRLLEENQRLVAEEAASARPKARGRRSKGVSQGTDTLFS